MRLSWIFLCVLSVCCGGAAQAVELHDYHAPDLEISTCKIDLQHDAIGMFWKDDKQFLLRSLSQLTTWLQAQGKQVLCATNGGIYERGYVPLGLYIENGITLRELNPDKNLPGNFYLQPNGIFLIRHQQVEIVDTDHFPATGSLIQSDIQYATQSGPILLQHGRINPLFSVSSQSRVIRNAVCISSPHEVELVLSRVPVSFYAFSVFLRDTLACRDALYLDGSISGMYPGNEASLGPGFAIMIAAYR